MSRLLFIMPRKWLLFSLTCTGGIGGINQSQWLQVLGPTCSYISRQVHVFIKYYSTVLCTVSIFRSLYSQLLEIKIMLNLLCCPSPAPVPHPHQTCISAFTIHLYLATVCSLNHGYVLVKPLISLYNLTVSFLHQKTVAIARVIYIFHMCVRFSLSLLPLTFLAGWNCFIIPPESVKSPSSYKLITHHWLFVWKEIKCRDFLGDRFV